MKLSTSISNVNKPVISIFPDVYTDLLNYKNATITLVDLKTTFLFKSSQKLGFLRMYVVSTRIVSSHWTNFPNRRLKGKTIKSRLFLEFSMLYYVVLASLLL